MRKHNPKPTPQGPSLAKRSLSWAAFGVAIALAGVSLYQAPMNPWVRAYLGLALIFAIYTLFLHRLV